MKFNVEKTVSNFVQSQFPQFYEQEGPNFILFLKAYYEWMESQSDLTTGTPNPIGAARNLLDYRDIDNTLETFLIHFQKKYLYGIPFNVIANKRFLLKHVLDVYRSKGSINCYKLLFKLLYNQEIDVYLPGNDILKPSDGTWVQPKYLEISDNGKLDSFVEQTIVGVTSGTTAVVEAYVKESVSQGIVSTLYISNILPQGGTFVEGENILIKGQETAQDLSSAPLIIGSLNSLNILNGGQGFSVGDVLKIAHYDVSNDQPITYGVNGLIRVSNVSTGKGALTFSLENGGFGYTPQANVFLYNGDGDTTGNGASFQIGSFSYLQNITYNTDLICDYLNLPLNSNNYNLPANTSANLSSVIGTSLTYQSNVFGSIASLTNINTGNGYTQQPSVFVRSTIISENNLPGTISFSSSSNTITGTNTAFLNYFSNGDVILLVANSTVSQEQIIKTVNSNTSITLYGPPSYSNAVGNYKAASVILPANFTPNDPIMFRVNNTINGKNEIIVAFPSVGNNIASQISVVDSGKGYTEGELIKAYLYGGLSQPNIISGGSGYSNGELLVFSGGGTTSPAKGYVTTNTSGGITAAVLTFSGSGYDTLPVISVQTSNGSGAVLSTSILEYNTISFVQGIVVKAGLGRGKGYWSTTRSFLNSDKYIQDSYFYQDYSYQIKAASTLDTYKNILYNTFHPAGTELFGKFLLINNESSLSTIIEEPVSAIIM